MTSPSNSAVQNLLPVQAYFNLDGSFNTFIGQGVPFYATANPVQSGLSITNSTINSSVIGGITPAAGTFTSFATTTGTIATQPVGATDIVNLLALQSYAAGISWKQPCAVATLTNITLSGLQTIDSYTTLAGDRVLVKNQSTAANNGIYIAASGAWTRSIDADAWQEFVSAISFIEYGTQAGGAWFCTATPGGTLGVTAINWSQFTTSATYSAGTGLTLTGQVFSITNTGVAASTYGSATASPVFAVNAQGQITSVTNTTITPAIGNVTGLATGIATFLQTPTSANLAAAVSDETGTGALVFNTSPTFITPALGTPASGVLTNATGLPLTTGVTGTLGIINGGTGLTTTPANGALDIGNGTGFTRTTLTAGTAIGITNAAGSITIANTGVTSIVAGTGISVSGATGAVTITNSSVMTYPGAGIPNSTGSAWGTSYSTTGTGTVVALATSPTFVTPTLGAATATSVTSGTFVANGTITGALTAGAFSYGTLGYSDINIYGSYTSSANAYTQKILQNTNSGAAASVDFIVSNNLGTASTYYGDFGITSSGYNTPGQNITNVPSTVYLQAVTTGLAIGTLNANTVTFYANSTQSAQISTAGVWTFANTITGSISGNAGTATTATTATNATNTAITDDTTTNATVYPTYVTTTTGNLPQKTASTKLSFNPSTGVLTTTGHTLGATGLTFSDGSTQVSNAVPQVTVYTSGSGTYTVPTNTKYLYIEMVGGGSGGASGGVSGGAATNGGSSTFGSSFLTAGGGFGQSGGTSTIAAGATGITVAGNGTGGNSYGAGYVGGTGGGGSMFAGGGPGGEGTTGGVGGTNTGGGGGGGGTNGTVGVFNGHGGGGGGGLKAYITSSIAATYSYAVGAGGSGGTAGTNGFAGGNGAAGVIIITAYLH